MSGPLTIHGITVLQATDGPVLRTPQDALDLIGDALGIGASLVVVPVSRLDPSFFQLRTGFAGEVVQKFVNYRIRLVVLGDISAFVSASTALRDFVLESNRGAAVWFLSDFHDLERRLTGPHP